MAWKLADLFVQISGDARPLGSTLGSIQQRLMGLVGFGGQIGGSLIGEIAGPLLGLSATAATGVGLVAVAAAAATAALGKTAMMAGHLTEAINKSEQVFGSSNGKLIALADELARKFGIVKTTVLDTAASFGLMLEGAGFDRIKAAEASATLVKLAADAKSFFDVPLEEAITRIQSGLSGEMEAVRRWGINLTELNVKQKAMAMGLFNGRGEMDQATKTAVRYQLILEGLKPAQGDLERTGGGLVQQWEKFTGQLTNLATTIGSVLLPVFTLMLRGLNSMLDLVGSQIGAWAEWTLWLAKASGILNLLGLDPGDEEKAAKQAEIDARIKATEDQFKADAAAGQQKPRKVWQGGLEEYAKKIANAAAGGNKDTVPKQQLAVQKQQLGVMQQMLARAGKNGGGAPMPAIAS